ncbi:PRC-barrel domain-containing protein [Pseudoclavibacter helvolus]|uniref:PRC-barrel domain-containing protein n=1 Tax=Pseudoclavibacter helvolus TaxID=255205 RepID=UPI003C788870
MAADETNNKFDPDFEPRDDDTTRIDAADVTDQEPAPVDESDGLDDDPIEPPQTAEDRADSTLPEHSLADGESSAAAALKAHEAKLTRIFQATVYGPGDERIGRVGQVYLDDQTRDPNWITVKTGFFGTKEYFIPLDLAELDEKRILVPYAKSQVTSAPSTEVDQNLSPAEEDALYVHYEVPGRMPENGTDTSLVDEGDELRPGSAPVVFAAGDDETDTVTSTEDALLAESVADSAFDTETSIDAHETAAPLLTADDDDTRLIATAEAAADDDEFEAPTVTEWEEISFQRPDDEQTDQTNTERN